MDDLNCQNMKAALQMQESVSDASGPLTGLKHDGTQISDDKDKAEVISLVTGTSNRSTKVKEKLKSETVRARTRSQRLKTSRMKNKNKFRTSLLDKVNKSSSSHGESASEDRYAELSLTEPKIEIHCKAKYIRLKPISKKDLDGKELYIEVQIDNDLIVSPIEKSESSTEEKSTYVLKVSMSKDKEKHKSIRIHSKTSNLNADKKTCKKLKRKSKQFGTSVKTVEKDTADALSRNKRAKQIKSDVVKTAECSSHILESHRDYDSDTDIEDNQNENFKEIKVETDETGVAEGDKTFVTQSESETAEIKSEKTKPRTLKNKSKEKKEPTSSVAYSTRITEEGEKMFGCPLCNYESKYSQNIRSHYLIHMNIKSWICEICGSAFVSKCNLRHHMVSHSEDRPFKCVTCGMGFKQKVVLQQHVARHNEERKFVCEQCGKGFCISGDLKKHIRTHTGEKPYTCEVCCKQFSDNSSYARHRYIHLETKNYACPTCNKRFSRQDMCNSHMKTHENGTGAKPKKGKVKRKKKSDTDRNCVVEETLKVENRDVAPREHLYHIENYAKEIQERNYTEMTPAGDFNMVNNGYPPQQHQAVQVYQQRQDPNIQESYSRDYTTMWANLHFY